jgi:hypothetical protein
MSFPPHHGATKVDAIRRQSLGSWISDIAAGCDTIAFKLMTGDTHLLQNPLHFGDGFVAGFTRDDGTKVAISYQAIASVSGYNNKDKPRARLVSSTPR